MIDFDSAKEAAFEGIGKTNAVERISPSLNAKLGFKHNHVLWKIDTEVLINGSIRDFSLFVGLKADFPLSLPHIYLSQENFEEIKYIPHVDDDRKICLYDQENIKIDPKRPLDILKACLNRAVKVIEDGVNKSNEGDFNEEVVAYWANSYHDKDRVIGAYVGKGVDAVAPGNIIIYHLNPAYNKINLIWGASEEESDKMLDFFRRRGHRIKETAGFYLGEISELKPPFYFTNKSFTDFVKAQFSAIWHDVKRYLNRNFETKTFVFSITVNEQLVHFGFYFYGFKTEINGWRAASLSTVQILTTLQAQQPVDRLTFKAFSPDRLKKRTDGILPTKKPYKFMIAGLGSIGSNLVPYLNALEVSDFKLVDPEKLQLENVNRHLLSFNDVGQAKVEGIMKYLLDNNPFLNVSKQATSVVNVIQKDLAEINRLDIIFCAIGKDAIETYILQCLNDGIIQKPVVLLWVEPYLLGAHLLYINPKTGFELKNMEVDGFYKFNVIAQKTYKNTQSQLLMKEAGCQDSYVPYGKEAIVQFFAAIIPELYLVIRQGESANFALTYIGDQDLARKLGLELSEFTQENAGRNLIKQIL